ncbi:uncharacterized protein EV420DRAFT_1696394, partial [Desarmillaria tabescens]
KSSSPSILKASSLGGLRGWSPPLSGSNNVIGNPHIDMRHMIGVAQNAMRGSKHQETPNVRCGPAFAADQVAPNSYLGRALKKSVGSAEPVNTPADEPDDSSSSSSSSSDDESSSGNERRKKKHHKKKKSSRRSRSHSRDRWEKPILPCTYNGSDDPKLVACFIQECDQYLKMGNVKDEDKVFRISRYLEGKARDFYDQSVSMNYNEWDLTTFFWEMFNYCFPRDFRAKVRRRIRQCFQGDRDVRAYAHELKGHYHMLGDESERTQVLRLWYGLRCDLREELSHCFYDEEINTWHEIVDMAEILDITQRRDEGKSRGDYEHNRRAKNRRTNETTERNKWNDIPRSKQDHTPKPARQSFNDELRELSGIPRKGPVRNWEKPVVDKKSPWHEHKLDKKQRDEYLAEGRCFRCGKVGHTSRQCPEGNAVASGSRSGPPGRRKPPMMSSSNIQFKLKEADRLSKAADRSTSFELNSIGLELNDDGVDDISSHSWTPTDAELWLDQPMGDMLDEWWTWRMNAETNWPDTLALGGHGGMEGGNPRFSMYRTKGVNFVLFDSLRDEQDEVLVPGNVVQYGDMVSWYRSYLIQTYCIPSVELPPPLGKDLMAMFIEEYLDNGFNDEFDGLAKRFTVSYKSPNVFHVKDRVLGHEFRLPRVMALHPKFRLYNWWLARVQRWEKTQLRTCCWSG